jgi:hypothetical protein
VLAIPNVVGLPDVAAALNSWGNLVCNEQSRVVGALNGYDGTEVRTFRERAVAAYTWTKLAIDRNALVRPIDPQNLLRCLSGAPIELDLAEVARFLGIAPTTAMRVELQRSVELCGNELPNMTHEVITTLVLDFLAMSITTTSLPQAVVDVPYSAQLRAVGGGGAPSWTATGLPSGLSLDPATGLISGTPTRGGSHDVLVTVSTGPGASASATLQLHVRADVIGTWTGTITTHYTYRQELLGNVRTTTLDSSYQVEFIVTDNGAGGLRTTTRTLGSSGSGASTNTVGGRIEHGHGCEPPVAGWQVAFEPDGLMRIDSIRSETMRGYWSFQSGPNCAAYLRGNDPPQIFDGFRPDVVAINNEIFGRVFTDTASGGRIEGERPIERFDRSRPAEGLTVDLTEFSISWSFAR